MTAGFLSIGKVDHSSASYGSVWPNVFISDTPITYSPKALAYQGKRVPICSVSF